MHRGRLLINLLFKFCVGHSGLPTLAAPFESPKTHTDRPGHTHSGPERTWTADFRIRLIDVTEHLTLDHYCYLNDGSVLGRDFTRFPGK